MKLVAVSWIVKTKREREKKPRKREEKVFKPYAPAKKKQWKIKSRVRLSEIQVMMLQITFISLKWLCICSKVQIYSIFWPARALSCVCACVFLFGLYLNACNRWWKKEFRCFRIRFFPFLSISFHFVLRLDRSINCYINAKRKTVGRAGEKWSIPINVYMYLFFHINFSNVFVRFGCAFGFECECVWHEVGREPEMNIVLYLCDTHGKRVR